MKQISQMSRILKISLPIIFLMLASKADADPINFVYDLSHKLNSSDYFQPVPIKILEVNSHQLTDQDYTASTISSSEYNNTQIINPEVFTNSFLQLSANDEFGLMAENTSLESTNNSYAIKLPLPATALLFGGALTWVIGLSRRTHKLLGELVYEYVDVLGVKFLNLNYDRAINVFQKWIISKQPHQVCFVNVHTLVSSLNDKKLREINNNALNAMDGMPVVWYAKLVQGRQKASKVCGPDLMLKCLDEGRNRHWKHYFLGGTEQVLEDLIVSMKNRFPGIEIVGWHSPAFRELTDHEDAELVQLINDAKPDFLWVGLGAPKQELWIASHLDLIHAPVQLGVGAAFNFHSGHIQRAPKWMQKSGLEWLYRIYKEKRLLKRYITTNPIFMFLLIRDFILIRVLKFKSPEYI